MRTPQNLNLTLMLGAGRNVVLSGGESKYEYMRSQPQERDYDQIPCGRGVGEPIGKDGEIATQGASSFRILVSFSPSYTLVALSGQRSFEAPRSKSKCRRVAV